MDFWVTVYIMITVVLGVSVVTFMYKRGQTMGAMILLVLCILVFIFYGLRWFPGGKLNGTGGSKVQWPPIINACPDFMVSWTDPAGSGTYCYDANNIYTLKLSGAGTATKLINGVNTPAIHILDNTGKNVKIGPEVMSSANPYLRWEGIWDGQTMSQ